MKRFFKFLLWTLIVLLVLVNIISATNAYKFTHFYDARPVDEKGSSPKSAWSRAGHMLFGQDYYKKANTGTPDSFATVTIETPDGIRLEGWYRHVARSNGSVALFHGYGDNKTKILPEAMGFLDMGYNVLLIDFRGHGNSSGHTCTIGYREADDVKAAYDFLADKGENHIVLWGISMGAASICHAVEKYHLQPSKVILEMPFATMKDAVEGQLNTMHLPEEPFGVLLTFWGGIEHGFWAFSMDPDQYAASIHCPVLLQQGVSDQRVKPAETREIFEHLHEPKHLILYQSSGHESLCKKEHLKWLATVSAFLNN